MTYDNKMLRVSEPLTGKNPVKILIAQKKCGVNDIDQQTKIYARRWLLLAVFVVYASANMSHWIQYSIISNIVSRYYGVSLVAVDWTSLMCMLAYVPLVFPASYLMGRIGLRWTGILGALVTAAGSWIKVLSVSPDRFYVAFIGQTMVASAQVFVFSIPGRLAANWFGSNQVSTATSIGLFGCQLGIAASFLLSPMIVRNHDNLADIERDLSSLYWAYAVFSTVACVAVVIFFKDDPPLPPTETRRMQKMQRSESKEEFLPLIKRLLTNRSYLALCHSFGINIGVLNSIATLLNQMYLIHYKNGEEEAGQIGLAIIITGMFGSVAFGMILDKTQKFKLTISIVYVLSLVGYVLFAIALTMEMKWMIYASAIFLGFFISGYFALGYEVCAEYTYPEPEGISTAILNITNQVYGIAIVLIFGKVIEIYGDVWAHLGISLILLVGLVTTLLTKDLQRRQDARKGITYKDILANGTIVQSPKLLP